MAKLSIKSHQCNGAVCCARINAIRLDALHHRRTDAESRAAMQGQIAKLSSIEQRDSPAVRAFQKPLSISTRDACVAREDLGVIDRNIGGDCCADRQPDSQPKRPRTL